MTEITKLFESFYEQHAGNTNLDSPSVKKAEKNLQLYLYEKFPEETQGDFIKPIYNLAKELECQAYSQGFAVAIKLMVESLNMNT